jgi:predicted NBD/HSP70 family sugar kinase
MNPLQRHSELAKRADQRAVRSFNLSAVARQIGEHGSRSRAQIAVGTGLNKTTVSSLVSELMARGVVCETGLDADGSVGRPAHVLELDGERIAALGLEINVDYMTVCVCDLRGRVRHHAVVGHDNRENSPEFVIDELARLARGALDVCADLGLTVVGAGVCVPGLIDARTSMLAYAPNLGWRSFAVGERMRQALDDPPFPIRVDNDGNLAALGELESGALRGVRHGLMLYGGIGVGGAVIIDGALFRGADGFAGEIGHVPVRPHDGERCSCGGRGCLETLVGQEAIARMVGIDGARSEEATPAVVLAERLRAGDSAALKALDEVAAMLGVGIAAAVNLVNPERVVLGGTFATLAEWLLPGVAATLADRMPDASPSVELRASALGEAATVRGGAALLLHELLADPTRAAWLSAAAVGAD